MKHHIDFSKITWGYRDYFKEAIDKLENEGFISGNTEVSNIFYETLAHAHTRFFDHVIKQFLAAVLSGNGRYLLSIASVLSDFSSLGVEIGKEKPALAIRYFNLWEEKAFGETPKEISFILSKSRSLLTKSADLALAFIETFPVLKERLSGERDIEDFIRIAEQIHLNSPPAALDFMRLKTKTSLIYLDNISKEVRLNTVSEKLNILTMAISSIPLEVFDIGMLDADEINMRGTSFVATKAGIYIPSSSGILDTKEKNYNLYKTLILIASSTFLFSSFSIYHGDKYENIEEMANEYKLNERDKHLLHICEITRVFYQITQTMVGTKQMLKNILHIEAKLKPHHSETTAMLKSFIDGKYNEFESVFNIIKDAKSVDAVLENIKQASSKEIYIPNERGPFSFFPDYFFPITISQSSPTETALSKDKDKTEKSKTPSSNDKNKSENNSNSGLSKNNESSKDSEKSAEEEESLLKTAAYYYDEWNEKSGEYYEGYCALREIQLSENKKTYIEDSKERTLKEDIKRVFEQMKYDTMRKEKNLKDGDNINIDRFVSFITDVKSKTSTSINFYEKTYRNKRDISVAILMDLSGSTAEKKNSAKRIIDFEKESVNIIASGLSEIGDNFGIFGFTGNGRHNAEYYTVKKFSEDYNKDTLKKLASLEPGSSTRMGVALRHTGNILAKETTKRKIIILVTDGKPMDSEYDPNTRYAQYDVKKANEENASMGIVSFCLSNEANSVDDLEIMFAGHRYIIVKEMSSLPALLSRYYIHLTA